MTSQSKQEELRSRVELKFLWILHTISDHERKSIEKCIEDLINSEVLAVLEELEKQSTSYETTTRNEFGIDIDIVITNSVSLSAIQTIKERYL